MLMIDDLFVTQRSMRQNIGIALGITNSYASSSLNQIVCPPSPLTPSDGYPTGLYNVVSHRSDTDRGHLFAEMVLALNVLDKSRRSAPSRTDRVAKYNHLLALEEAIGATAQYPDATLFIT